jgi:signal transduction histidine kinase
MQEITSAEPVALDPLFADVVETTQTAAQQKAITLTAEVDSDLPSIRADRNHLKQLFAVLVQNAVKYTPHGGKVTLRAARDDDRVRVEVEDTGIGVPPEDCEKVFDEFHRAGNARLHERAGTGLGLTIARKIARDLGGDIEIQSTLGRGSTFTVTIPVPPSTE